MNRRGAVLVAFVFIAAAFFLFLDGALVLVRVMADNERAQTIADTTALSVLRLRAKALRTVADRWDGVGRDILSADSAGVVVPASRWSAVSKAAQQVSASLSGYQGRLTAVMTVLAGAYDVPRSDLVIADNAAGRLGISPQPFLMRDENENSQLISAGWYKRTWSVDAILNPAERVVHRYGSAVSGARLLWEADGGNGGYPADWGQARVENNLAPFRYPFFRAELTEP
jgi:hypothetical protein